MDKTKKVMVLSAIILVGFTLGVIYHYILGAYLKLGEPYNTFVYPSSMAFCDFLGAIPFIKDFAPYQDVTLFVVYFPLTYILIFPFIIFKNLLLSYIVFISMFLSFLIFMNIKNFSCENLPKLQNFQNIFILSIISYPVLYNLDKGNFDMFLFIIVGLWMYAFKAEKYPLSAILLAIANAIKPFTFLFLFLYLFKKKYKEFFISAVLTAFLIIGGFFVFKDNFISQVATLIKSWKLFKVVYANNLLLNIGFSSSMFIPLKAIFLHLAQDPKTYISSFTRIYDYMTYLITLITIFFVWREKTFWKQLTLLMCNFLLVPYVTYDYKLIFLYLPLWLFVNEKEKSKFDFTYIVLFGLLFIPKSIIIFLPPIANSNNEQWLSLSVILNPIIMIIFSLLIIYEQFSKKKIEQNKEHA